MKGFDPQLSPQEMLELGVFGGHYFKGDISEYPLEWFEKAKISESGFDANARRSDSFLTRSPETGCVYSNLAK